MAQDWQMKIRTSFFSFYGYFRCRINSSSFVCTPHDYDQKLLISQPYDSQTRSHILRDIILQPLKHTNLCLLLYFVLWKFANQPLYVPPFLCWSKLYFGQLWTFCIVIQKLFNQIDMCQHHTSTAISLEAQSIHCITDHRNSTGEIRRCFSWVVGHS